MPDTTTPPRHLETSECAARGVDRLGAERLAAILTATLEALAEDGYDRVTLDDVARRAHASKATIYRRWTSKADLVTDAIALLRPPPAAVDTGSLAGDLHALYAELTGPDPLQTKVTTGVATALRHHPDLMAAFEERFSRPRQVAVRAILERAVARGEAAADCDAELLGGLVPALLLCRLLFTSQPVDDAYLRRIIDTAVLPLAAGPSATPIPRRRTRPTRRKETP